MKKILLAMLVLAMFTISAKSQHLSQSYTTALGVKVWGDGAGISLKHFISTNHALEGVAYFWNQGIRITGLYEFHFDIDNAPGLKWYVGPGAHIGFYNNDGYYNNGNNNSGGAFVGIDGVLGLDYKFKGAPINLSLDWQPSIEFGNGRGFVGGWGGLGIRYTF